MTFKEIANRITGISFPLFGISWNPPKLEKKVAENVIIFLEDRRVLYNPFELESPEYCKQSIIKIREFLTQQLFDIEKDSELGRTLNSMRNACRKFLDMTTENYFYFNRSLDEPIDHRFGMGSQILFYSGIGELRGTFGILIAKLLIMYGIDCDSELIKIIPIQIIDE